MGATGRRCEGGVVVKVVSSGGRGGAVPATAVVVAREAAVQRPTESREGDDTVGRVLWSKTNVGFRC